MRLWVIRILWGYDQYRLPSLGDSGRNDSDQYRLALIQATVIKVRSLVFPLADSVDHCDFDFG